LPYDSSTKQARELKAGDWGTPEEIAEMAEMPRKANNRPEAKVILGEMVNKEFINRSGITAYIPKGNIGKLVSSEALHTSFNAEAHYLAVANIDKLYKNSIKKWDFELNPDKKNNALKERYYLYSPMEYNTYIVPVKITVKEYKNKQKGAQIYTIEAVDVELGKSGRLGEGVVAKSNRSFSPRKDLPVSVLDLGAYASLDYSLSNLFDSVNTFSFSERVREILGAA